MPSCSTMPSASTPRPVLPSDSGFRWVKMCIRVELNQTKNGFLSLLARSMKSSEASRNSSSTVSMRFLVSGPVSSHFCLPHGAEARVVAGRLGRGRDALQHAARTEIGAEVRILGGLRVVGVLRLFLGVEVIEVAEELVEAVHGRQELVAVAEMVLAELAGHIALRLEQFGERRVLVRQAFLRRRQPDLQQAGADRALAGDEGGAAGGAGLLGVIVGEDARLRWRSGRCWACGSPSCRDCRR